MKKINALILVFILIFSIFTVLPIKGFETNKKYGENDTSINTDKFGDGKTEYWALIVGTGKFAEDYDYSEMWETPEKLKEVLLESPTWSEDHIKIITRENATFKNIIKGLKWLDSMEDADDICLLHFNTHGGSIPFDVPPRDEADKKDEILVTYWGFALPYTNILDDTLNLFLGRLESKGTVVIIDCCNAGGFNDPPWYKRLDRPNSRNPRMKINQETYEWMHNFGKELRQSGRVVIMCCEEDESGHWGGFSPYMLDAFRGFGDTNQDYIITAEEVYSYAKLRSPKHLQNPTIYDDYEGELPLLEVTKEFIEPIKNPIEKKQKEKPILEISDKSNEQFKFPTDEKPLVGPLLQENSLVCGYITDNKTNEPLKNVNVTLYWQNEDEFYINYSYSNNQGFYSFNTASGEIALVFNLKKYAIEIVYWLNINENETLWVNVSMIKPVENSKICGYIKDNFTNEPIENTNISLYWTGYHHSYYFNYTLSDSTGFYSMNVPKGYIELDIFAEGYFENEWPEYSYYNMSENETKWVNISLYPIPPENSIVKGYITNSETEEPIEDATIKLYWCDDHGNHQRNYSNSDSLGFYSMNVAAGKIRLYFYEDVYFGDRWPKYDDYNIAENETKWVNISLYPIPPENSIVKGYITDSETEEPIQNAYVNLDWEDAQGHYQSNYTITDSLGFYSMNVAQGYIKLYVNIEGYFYVDWPEYGYYNISDYETKWVNISLYPKPHENSIVQGYITDSETGEPIEDASINLDWKDEEGNYLFYYTKSDSFGFYNFFVAKGSVKLCIYTDNYTYKVIDWFDIEDNESVWVNVSLNPQYYDYTVNGFIRNSLDNSPVDNASIYFLCEDNWGNNYHKNTKSEISGFYSVKLQKGYIDYISVNAEGFFDYYSEEDYPLNKYLTLWINISIIPFPPETAKINGYIKDIETNKPIENASIDLDWYEDYQYGPHYYNETTTDELGFFRFNVAAGLVYLWVSAEGYHDYQTFDLEINDYETIWVNISLEPLPPENAVVCGYIKDVETNLPLYNVSVDLNWEDFNHDHRQHNHTYTLVNGFYSMNVAEGFINIGASMDGYLIEYSRRSKIYENEVLWMNLSMYPKPPRNSIVCGYITDEKTGEPLKNAYFYIDWIGCEWHHDFFSADDETGNDGYYQINVPAGELYIESRCYNYNSKHFERQDIGENEILWFNISLDRMKVDVEIIRPLSAIYSNSRIRIPFVKPLIFGNIVIQIHVLDCEYLESLSLFIDGELRFEIHDEPNDNFYNYLWTRGKIRIFDHEHTIKVVAVDIDGNTDIEEIEVTRFF